MPGVYVSYPFCAQKCTYCNFASGVFPRELEARYVDRLRADLASYEWPWTPETVYLGGGTPSGLSEDELAAVLAAIPGKPWREATIEVAPGGLTEGKARAWRSAGINRVSLGVQSFTRSELARTGRKHSAETVEAEIAMLRAAGIANINVDLIAGLPGQTAASWNESLGWIEGLGVPHVSVYMLEVDDDSRLGAEVLAFGKRYGAADVPSELQIVEFYETAVERLRGMGIARYEISNFARPGYESVHNLKYWRREPYLGFGSDAHSFDGSTRWQNVESPKEYVEGGEAPTRTAADARAETFFLGLRLDEGVAADWAPYDASVRQRIEDGLLDCNGTRLRLTPRGILFSNEVFADFL